jgi:hypothetical protein
MRTRRPVRTTVAAAALLAALAGPAAAQEPVEPAGPDAFMSDNVSYVGSIKQDAGLTTGAKVIPSTGPGVPDKLFVTSGKNITAYDISDPTKPRTIGAMQTNVAWENEEVPTNGKLLAVASDFYSIGVPDCVVQLAVDGCVQIFDVRDPANMKQVGVIPIANHTAECALDCQYLYGRAGTIIDARGALDGKAPTVLGNWQTAMAAQGVSESSCHHIRELRPGILLTACRPFAVISINAADGGTPAFPKVLYTGQAAKFVHSARWPRNGTDKFVLTGGEQNFTVRCERNNSEFSTYSAEAVLAGRSKEFQGPIAQVVPTNGVYADGHAPAEELGCSVHWFQEHPTFKNGGLVALSEYGNGVRFLQIKKDGSILEQGYFIALGSSSSSPKWAPDGKTLYSLDYHRGIDIISWNGDTYVPGGKPPSGAKPGTDGKVAPAALTAAQQQQSEDLAQQLLSDGWSPGLCYLAAGAGAT